MNTADKLMHYPIGVAARLPEPESTRFLEAAAKLPESLRPLMSSPRTSAFIRGLAKNHSIPTNQIKYIAYAILVVTLGEKTMANLPVILSTRLKLPNDKAQKLAAEIERELFAPVALAHNQYLTRIKKQDANSMSARAQEGGASNILDLKNKNEWPKSQSPHPPPAKQ